jgi:hypothetical protein
VIQQCIMSVMSMVKRWAEERLARGFDAIDGRMCLDHIIEPELRSIMEATATVEACELCADAKPDTLTVTLEDVLSEVMVAVRHFYTTADGLPWDSEDQMYAGPVFDTDEVVADICDGVFADKVADRVLTRMVSAMGVDEQWTDWGAAADPDSMDWGWRDFAELVRTTTRFVLIDPSFGTGPPHRPPVRVAAFLAQLKVYVDGNLGLVQTLPAGSALFRGRLVTEESDVPHTAADLGPAPSDKTTANRMSPAGVSLMYASQDAATAIAEIAGHGDKPNALVGSFRTVRDLTILDLTLDTQAVSIFTKDGRHAATMARFLKTFVYHVTKPVIPDGNEHVEYAPTQVLTEYLRWAPDTSIDGIAFPSSQTGKPTYVLFFGYGYAVDHPVSVTTPPLHARWQFGPPEDDPPTFTLEAGDITLYPVPGTEPPAPPP